VRGLGIGDGHRVVVYDGAGLFSAARVWWLFRLMGKTNVAVLDGGFPKWQAEGRPVEEQAPTVQAAEMSAAFQPHLVRAAAEVAAASDQATHTIIDARPAERFAGSVAEPRPGMRSGHIPGSKNVPFPAVLNTDKTMKSPEALRDVFADAAVEFDKPIMTTCGSGVTAAILCLALEQIGETDYALYDGSWAEWGASSTLPIATPIATGET